MNCILAENNLKALMGGELPPAEARETRRHLASCPACWAKLSPMEWVEVLPGTEEEIEPSPAFARDFYRKAHHRREAGPAPWWGMAWVRPVHLAATGALALILVWGVVVTRIPRGVMSPSGTAGEPGTEETVAILKDMGVIHHLDLLEDFETIADLGALGQDAN